MSRYDAVVHLRTPTGSGGYNHQNPVRIESAEEAADIDTRIARAWESHPRRFFVEASSDFLDKAARALDILRGELPECCRRHVVPLLVGRCPHRSPTDPMTEDVSRRVREALLES